MWLASVCPWRTEFWESAIRAFEEADRARRPAPGGAVFTGSSSIRFWRTLEADMVPVPALNRGFGGCHMAHVAHFARRIVTPYRPRAVVVYAGENDLGWLSPKTPRQVVDDFRRLVDAVREELPAARVYFLAVKPSPFRRGRWPAFREVNALAEQYAREADGVTFLDTAAAMRDANGRPRPGLYRWDGLHLSDKGYQLWASVLRPALARDLGFAPVPQASRGTALTNATPSRVATPAAPGPG
jgi:lysophospholipase L1-like esterase